MKLIDTHCHIDSDEFDRDREQVLKAACEHNIEKIIVPAVTKKRWKHLLCVCASSQALYPALGLHPVYLNSHSVGDLDELERQIELSPVVAIGEIGLDYYIQDLDRDAQREMLDTQFSIAEHAGLPVILHCRKAYDDLVRLITSHNLNGGIAHAFNGSIQQAHKLIDLGFKLGFGGMLTYERSSKLRKLAKNLPLASIVLETDSPDLTVVQHRGERNSPEYLPFVLQALASIRNEPVEEMAYTIYQTSLNVFDISA